MPRPHIRIVAALAFVLALSSAVPALAQERLFLYRYGRNSLVEIDTRASSFGTRRSIQPIQLPFIFSQVTPLAGGRFLLLSGFASLALFDTRASAILVPPQWATFQAGEIIAFDSDALRPRIFYRTTAEFGVIEGPSFIPRVLAATEDPDFWYRGGSLKYVSQGNLLLITRTISATQAQIVAFDADTAAFKGAIALDGRPGPMLVDALSNRLHVPVEVALSQSKLQTYDLDTFTLVNETAVYPLSLSYFVGGPQWTFDPARQRVLRSDPGYSLAPTAWAVALDPGLRVVAHVDFGQRWPIISLMPSPVGERAFALLMSPGYGGSSSGGPVRARAFLAALDATTLQPMASVDLLGPDAPFESFTYSPILLTPPPPPIALAHTVTDRRVELTWRDPGDATHFLIQVGTEPGRSNLGTFHVGAVTKFASEVPPGRYYVRARAVNDVGWSVPSNEVVVEVVVTVP